MDSLTQAVLGAGVGAALLGRRLGPRRAAVLGAVLGTLPDLDVFFPFDDPVDSFVLHRGATHSLLVQTLAAPLFGEALLRLFKALRAARGRVYLAVYLCFATHALLDAMTVYGTRIFWPLWPQPLGLGSVFIIDPLYTLPLLLAFLWALSLRAWTPRFGGVLALCVLLSSAYLGWGAVVQRLAEGRAVDILAARGVTPARLLAIPTPFNSLFWRVIAMDGQRYFNVYLPVLGGEGAAQIHLHPSGQDLAACLDRIAAAGTLAAFTKGFYRLEQVADELLVADLRMGLTPNYVFRFAVARWSAEGFQPIAPRRVPSARRVEGDFAWLTANLGGTPSPRPAEVNPTVAPSMAQADALLPATPPRSC